MESEESSVRGIILPRQKVVYGRWAWPVHGLLWTLFHFFQRWTYLQILPATLVTSYVVSRTKNTTVGIVAHFIGNAVAGWLPIILAVAGIGIAPGTAA
jgi:membrane protease YdiL (CAAX protease family)